MARLQPKTQAAVTTGLAKTRPSLRDGFNGLYVISPGTGSLAPVPARCEASSQVGISTGMPGPHDFAVRAMPFVREASSAATRRVHRIPFPRP
jgi:hypothetical protein